MRRIAAISVVLSLTASAWLSAAEYSQLWGRSGEKWSPESRLPDFSYAGYHCGEKELPKVARGVSVKDFGAKGDGKTDDTEAFLKAISTVKQGAIEIPPGRYRITKILEIKRPNLVLRGVSPERSVLHFPVTLHDVKPNWGATTGGQKTSNYSWSGGFVWVQGSYRQKTLATIVGEAKRGARSLQVSSTKEIQPGQRVEIYQSDNADNSLAAHLYSNEPGDTAKLNGRTHASLVCRVLKVAGDRIEFDRSLRFDVQAAWKPQVRSFDPSVTEVGIENLTFEFPNTPYGGHFTELGYNAIALTMVSDCWVRNIRIVNCDSGLFPGCHFCTIQRVVFESNRKPDRSGSTGHHGIYLARDDNLFTEFDYRTQFIHDISVSHCAGNVCSCGKGVDLCFDHHKRTPYENLFTDIDAGKGTHLWRCGGGAALGKHCAARGTFWNVRAERPLKYPPANFGPWSMNLVGVQTDQPSRTEPDGIWFEAISPSQLGTKNLHQSQLQRRLKAGAPAGSNADRLGKTP